MSQKTRIQKLELSTPVSGICVLARVPADWTSEERDNAMRSYADVCSLSQPFTTDIQEDPVAECFEVYWHGILDDALKAAASNPVRIGAGR